VQPRDATVESNERPGARRGVAVTRWLQTPHVWRNSRRRGGPRAFQCIALAFTLHGQSFGVAGEAIGRIGVLRFTPPHSRHHIYFSTVLGELAGMARAAPVATTKYDRAALEVLAIEEYERLARLDSSIAPPESPTDESDH
jgi:hypothetical protein